MYIVEQMLSWLYSGPYFGKARLIQGGLATAISQIWPSFYSSNYDLLFMGWFVTQISFNQPIYIHLRALNNVGSKNFNHILFTLPDSTVG